MTRKASTVVGDPSHPAESRPADISEFEVGDDVVIEPEPSVETDAPDEIRGEVIRAEQHTCEMPGDADPPVTGEIIEIEADDGETYERKGSGTVFLVDEDDWHTAIAFDSSLRLEGGESA